MKTKEDQRLHELEHKLERLRHTLKEIIPFWSSLDRKRLSLENEIKHLEDERLKLTQGQMVFDGTYDF